MHRASHRGGQRGPWWSLGGRQVRRHEPDVGRWSTSPRTQVPTRRRSEGGRFQRGSEWLTAADLRAPPSHSKQCTMHRLLTKLFTKCPVVYRGIEAISTRLLCIIYRIPAYDTVPYLAQNLKFQTRGNWIFPILIQVVSFKKNAFL